ncbi:MAG TPA: type IV pilin-like G/H family protein [Oscillatoriales cyanobacterium M59_W2019_021]|nr:MAG: hypothetical protein D6728_09015 [Cyanobacteria bacterium J055]HIK33855.1 type IV pilin-like G/H family protein [Oscillatoriales cyanobacterium M4454_W2019_049]HIK51683.1 type IV pilin-like G/H family protein [Oscillatoriales cyanobacterium M59_W2019_021]
MKFLNGVFYRCSIVGAVLVFLFGCSASEEGYSGSGSQVDGASNLARDDRPIQPELGYSEEQVQQLEKQAQQEEAKARQSEGKFFVGAVNRAQQAYRLENPEFASTMEELQIILPPEGTNYQFEIVPQPAPTLSVMATATAKSEGIRSYAGAVFVLESGARESILCETNEPSQMPPEMPAPPASRNDRPQCPTGSSPL